MGQSNSAPTTSNVISAPNATVPWASAPKTVSLANAQARPQTLNMHPNLKREPNRRMNAAPNAVAPSAGGSRRNRRNKKKTRRHKK